MNTNYKLRINFILVLWVVFLAYRILLSGSIDLIHHLSIHDAFDFKYSGYLFSAVLILAVKYLGLGAALLVIFNIKRKIFYPVFLFSVFYFCFIIYKLIGSYGIWLFYFIPGVTIYAGMLSNRYKDIFSLIVLSYCLFYFYAGFAKIFPFWNLPGWLNGYTVENLIASRMHESILYRDMGINILDFPRWLFKSGVIASVLLELSAFLIILKYGYYRIIVPLILSFHLFLFLTGTPGIVEYTFAAMIFMPLSIISRLNETKILIYGWIQNKQDFAPIRQ